MGKKDKQDQEKRSPIAEYEAGTLGDLLFRARMVEKSLFGIPDDCWDRMLHTLDTRTITLGVASALYHGAKKYSWEGWRDVDNALERYKDAAIRHYLHEIYYPQDKGVDSESGLSHFYHAAANLAIVIELMSEEGV